jgi:hypothetical protein
MPVLPCVVRFDALVGREILLVPKLKAFSAEKACWVPQLHGVGGVSPW